MVIVNCLQRYALFAFQVYHIVEFLSENLDVLQLAVTGSVNLPMWAQMSLPFLPITWLYSLPRGG